MRTDGWALASPLAVRIGKRIAEALNGDAADADVSASVVDEHITPLVALLRESRREHLHCDDSWYCCRACRSSDHMLVEGEHLGHGYDRQPHEDHGKGLCTCGADAWNARVDAVLSPSETDLGKKI